MADWEGDDSPEQMGLCRECGSYTNRGRCCNPFCDLGMDHLEEDAERWQEQRMDDRIAADWDQQAQLRRAEAGWLRER